MERRDFLKASVGAMGLGALGGWPVRADDEKEKKAPIARRDLGRTGFEATILGFGGYPISEVGEKQAVETIEAALEEGVNYFDTASTYGDHTSERYLSKVLPGVERGRFFLATKTLQRSRGDAEREIAESLRSLKLQPDLLQIHAVNDDRALDAVMKKGGAFEAARKAKESGEVRFLGITGHTRPEVISRALDLYDWDTVLIPLGAPDRHLRSFEDVMTKAREKGAAVIGMKVLSGGHAIGKMPLEPLFHYTWNLPVATAIVGARSKAEVGTAAAAVRAFKPLGEARVAEILAQAKPLGNAETLWWKRL